MGAVARHIVVCLRTWRLDGCPSAGVVHTCGTGGRARGEQCGRANSAVEVFLNTGMYRYPIQNRTVSNSVSYKVSYRRSTSAGLTAIVFLTFLPSPTGMPTITGIYRYPTVTDVSKKNSSGSYPAQCCQ